MTWIVLNFLSARSCSGATPPRLKPTVVF